MRKSKVSQKRQKNEQSVTTHFKALREAISTRVDISAILTSSAITSSPEAFNGVGLFYEK